MTFHESPDFKDALSAAANHFKLRPVLVEKDYWVTYVLRNLSASELASQVVFKGGTSLSKAYNCINRFSEDIDLAILDESNLNDNQINKLIKSVEAAVSKGLEYVPNHSKEIKRGRNRTTIYKYPKTLAENNFGIVKGIIQLEINSFTKPVPHNNLPIQSYLGQFLIESGNKDDIAKFNMQPFPIQVLALERTFFEKMLSVNRLSYTGIDPLKAKIRHFYDIHQLYHHPDLLGSILTEASYGVLKLAIKDDESNVTFAGEWSGKPLSHSPLFSSLDDTWKALTPTYQSDLSDLVWDELPATDSVLAVLKLMNEFLKKFDVKTQMKKGSTT